jgi:2-keto-4-pentenoate hydratase
MLPGCKARELPGPAGNDQEVGIAEKMLSARLGATPASWLLQEAPDLQREAGFRIQKLQLETQLEKGETLTGWKMGGTRITDPGLQPDPFYGYSLTSNLYSQEEPVSPAHFVDAAPLVEAEVAIWIGKDLVGPAVTRDELLSAISGVGGAIELVSPRLTGESVAPTVAQLLTDNVAHAGAIPGEVKVGVNAFDFDGEIAVARIEGEEKARGSSKDIMGEAGTPLDAALWLANELPRHGLHLKAGEFILTGSLYDNPTLHPGESIEIEFSTLGTIRMTLADL